MTVEINYEQTDEHQENTDQEANAAAEEAEADAAFMAGFNGDEGKQVEAPTDSKREDTGGQQAQEADKEASEQDTSPPESDAKPVLAGLTEEQLSSVLAKAAKFDDLEAKQRELFGRYGDLNQKITGLLQGGSKGGGKLKLKFEKLAAEYPEFAQVLQEDFDNAEIEAGSGQGQQIDTDQINKLVNDRIDDYTKQMEMRLFKSRHKDHQEVLKSDQWKIWLTTVDDDDRSRMASSWDGVFLSDMFDKYKGWAKSTKNNGNQGKQGGNQNTNRIRNSAQPQGGPEQQGSGAKVLDDEAAFILGFKNG